MISFRRAVGIGLLGSLTLMGLGCNPVQNLKEKAIEGVINRATGDNVNVDLGNGTDNPTITVKDPDSGTVQVAGKNVKIPDGFPTEIFRYQGAETLIAMSQGDKSLYLLVQKTPDSQEKVVSWLEGEIKKAGRKITLRTDANGYVVIQSSKDKQELLTKVEWLDSEKKTTISSTLTPTE